MRKVLVGVAIALWLASAAHAAAATRILYIGDWTGHPEVFAVDPSGKAPPAQLTHWHGRCPALPIFANQSASYGLFPSPDGRYLLVVCTSALWLMRADGSGAREVVAARGPYPDEGGITGAPLWSRNSKQFVYSLAKSTHVRTVATGDDHEAQYSELRRLGWWGEGLLSPDRRWIAQVSNYNTVILRAKDGATVGSLEGGFSGSWSPDAKWLAVESSTGIRAFDMRTRRVRRLTSDVGFGDPPRQYEQRIDFGFGWAPDSRSVVYATGFVSVFGSGWGIRTGDVRTASLNGKVRSVVSQDRAFGGRITAVAWAPVPKGLRYGVPESTPAERVARDGVLAPGRVALLAADGARVAFEACDRVFVWTPAQRTLEASPHSDGLSCSYADITGHSFRYDLALAGDRLFYALNEGCMSIRVTVHVQPVTRLAEDAAIASGWGNCASPFSPALGRLAAAGDLAVYGEWTESYSPGTPWPYHFPVKQAVVRRVDAAGCPCPAVASTNGPLYPADVSEGRVVAYGDNATLVLDRDGRELASLPISPLAAQLSGDQLILITPGALRDYDIRGASPLHTWPLPDVSAGPVCGWRSCDQNRLVLSDAARGLVAYILDGQLHVLRLADGADMTLDAASLARFMDDGLVYADGARIHFLPWTSLR